MYHTEIEFYSETLISYLTNRSWTHIESESDIAIFRKIINDQEEEIVLPIDRTYADYRQRINEAIQFLAKYENVSEKTIIEELRLQK